MTVLVVGATGYVGGALVDALLSGGRQVRALSRSAGADTGLRARAVETRSGDLSDLAFVGAAAEGAAACFFTPGLRMEGAEAVEQAALVAVLSRLPTGAPLVYVSGSTVYGQTDATPARETDSVTDSAKVRLERIAFDSARAVPMIVRPGLVTGRTGGITGRLRDTARRLGRLPRIGPIDRWWSTVDVDDLARLCIRMAERPERGQILNAARLAPVRLSDLFDACCRDAGVALDPGSASRQTLLGEIGPVALLLDRHAVISPAAAHAFGWTPRLA